MIYSVDVIQWPLVQPSADVVNTPVIVPTIVSAPSAESNGQQGVHLTLFPRGLFRLPVQFQLKTPVSLDSSSSGVGRERWKQKGLSGDIMKGAICVP